MAGLGVKAAVVLAIGSVGGVAAPTMVANVVDLSSQVLHGLQGIAGDVSPSTPAPDSNTSPTIPK